MASHGHGRTEPQLLLRGEKRSVSRRRGKHAPGYRLGKSLLHLTGRQCDLSVTGDPKTLCTQNHYSSASLSLPPCSVLLPRAPTTLKRWLANGPSRKSTPRARTSRRLSPLRRTNSSSKSWAPKTGWPCMLRAI